jgi:predicted nucleic acid-binding protein
VRHRDAQGEPPPLVVDASVALKWALNDEEAVDQAVALRDDGLRGFFRMVAPGLWSYEVANGLFVAARRKRLTFAEGARALPSLHALGVQFAEPEPGDAFAFAHKYGIAVYDAAYLALAARLEAELWTGDRKLYETTAAANVPWVRWIADYSLYLA